MAAGRCLWDQLKVNYSVHVHNYDEDVVLKSIASSYGRLSLHRQYLEESIHYFFLDLLPRRKRENNCRLML